MVSKVKWVAITLFITLLFVSCDDETGFDPNLAITGIYPNSVQSGDTLNILVGCAEYNLNITDINQVKVSLTDNNNSRFLFDATGYWENHNRELGNIAHSPTIDSLAYNGIIVQCIVNEKFPTNAKVGVFLNSYVRNSDFIVTVNNK